MPRRTAQGRTATGKTGMPDNIKKVATELVIAHGYHGASFGNIANRLGTTTTTVHYHFGTKQRLIEEIVSEYVASSIERHRAIWLDVSTSLSEKLAKVVEYNYERYKRFNRGKRTGKPWSLIGRLRLENDVLSEPARASLSHFTQALHEAVDAAVENAWQHGQLRPETPREDLSLLLTNIVDSSSVFAQDAGKFERLEQFFATFSRVVLSAYAAEGVSNQQVVQIGQAHADAKVG